MGSYQTVKRACDASTAVALLMLSAPIWLVIAAAVKVDSPGPVFFTQMRLGRGGRPIQIVKFRTMIQDAPETFLPDGSRLVEVHDARVTRVGRVLRLGLDELPQLVAVLRGDMSLVGPRPDDLFALPMYVGSERTKLSVRPGMTGLAQVSGRSSLPWRTRLKFDAYYVEHESASLDVRILCRTASVLVGRRPRRALVTTKQLDEWMAVHGESAQDLS